tara:strand:+ start:7740 stop:8780 length:1041 start_codon:yes stop_codon:yes gene_type:complete
MIKKFVFIINPPRGGGVSIISLSRILNNAFFFVWPYEFLYFNLFNQATNNKKLAKGEKLNNFFFNEVKKKLYMFSKKKIDYIKFKRKLFNKNNLQFNSIEYLTHLAQALSSSYKNNSKIEKFLIVYVSARGFDWSKVSKKNIFFLKSNRAYIDSFLSIRDNTIGASGFYNFFNFKGKKSLFYWMETFRRIISNYNKKLPRNRSLTLDFENISFNKAIRNKINNNNAQQILNFLNAKERLKKKNFFSEVHKKKIKNQLKISNIENYIINNYIYKKKINFLKFLFNLFCSLNFFISNLIKAKDRKIALKVINIFFTFIIFYFSMYKNKKLYNLLISGNSHIKYMEIWK